MTVDGFLGWRSHRHKRSISLARSIGTATCREPSSGGCIWIHSFCTRVGPVLISSRNTALAHSTEMRLDQVFVFGNDDIYAQTCSCISMLLRWFDCWWARFEFNGASLVWGLGHSRCIVGNQVVLSICIYEFIQIVHCQTSKPLNRKIAT